MRNLPVPFTSPLLASCQGISHGFFTRQGGVSTATYESLNCSETSGDFPLHVQENKARIAQAMGVTPGQLVMCAQVHSSRAIIVHAPWAQGKKNEADAMVTRERGLALGILTADCAPVLFADSQAGIIAAAHAGWRGALQGILESTLCMMEGQGADRSRIVAAIGPCIWQESYEVDNNFLSPFVEENEDNRRFFAPSLKEGHFLFDLPCYVAAKLKRLDIQQISLSPADTLADEGRFFSHRRGALRGEPERGRMLSCIALGEEI